MTAEKPMTFHRYEDDSWGISHIEYTLTKETPQGYWISQNGWGIPRWVSKTGKKRHAYPSKELALESYLARKARQVELLTNQLDRARQRRQRALQLQEGTATELRLFSPSYSMWDY